MYLKSKPPVEIGLFIPCAEDSSNRVANILAERIANETKNINLRIFTVKQKKCTNKIDELRKKQFLHSDILEDVVFPFQNSKGLSSNPDGVLLCPKLLEEKYPDRVYVEYVEDINDADFINKRIIKNINLRMAFSVRNLQIFHDAFIKAFTQKGDASLMNAHPAALPNIRGLEGPFWTRINNIDEYTTTLHIIIREIDAGDIVDYATSYINKTKEQPIAHYTRDAAPELSNMIFKQLHLQFVKKGAHNGINIQKGEVKYYTVPTIKEIDKALSMGLIITDSQKQISWLMENYSNRKKNLKHYMELLELILNHYRKFDASLSNSEYKLDKTKIKSKKHLVA